MNTLCRDTGEHDFVQTTGDNYRKCQRTNCKATQRLYRGRWVDVVRRVAKTHKGTEKPPIQGILTW